ncbi:rhomboid family intramembrane serine protease [Ginsengibacter hankyongi]|uniref:Rhomboid family intramembrane serine protease n=1 Tax=Ginsengibacter hankyongi TaxID=2607284 RepID=A0A5J5IN83_9BACT|nr:rhomboid family intramembrane serine protease [Ginsengibacter hankyongi]KAA9041998.1 rhomboid family intramembrane serine protease [Ginsengibacter hankyongi]
MGESERYIDRRARKITLGEDNNALVALIAINAFGLIIPGLIRLIYILTDSSAAVFASRILPWFILPAKLATLAKAPWTILSYMFVHTHIIAAFTNMLWLWAFGSILQDMAGNKKIFPVYLYGGIAGAIVFIATNYAIPQLRPFISSSFFEGASASIMAVAIATTALAPDYRIFRMLNGGIPLWVLTILFIIIDIASVGTAAPAYLLAHLTGGLTGFLFIVALRRGYDGGAWMLRFYNWFLDLCNPDKKILTPQKTKEKLFYKTGNQKPFEKHSIITQQRIDEILDKINQKGFHLLSEEEKNILKRAGESDF